MDNKITKARFSHFMEYFWLPVILATAGVIFVWALLFQMTSVKLSVGQTFNYFYDDGFDFGQYEYFYNKLKDDNVFSYDVLSVGTREIFKDGGQLHSSHTIQEGDAFFTSLKETEVKEGIFENRTNFIIDNYRMYGYDELLEDATEYLLKFVKDGEENSFKEDFDYDKLSEEKIAKHFTERMKKDNRYRAGQIDKTDEYQRIQTLCENVADFNRLIEYGKTHTEIFYNYLRFTQTCNNVPSPSMQKDYDYYKSLETEKNYGLILQNMPTDVGKRKAKDDFRLREEEDRDELSVLLIYNYKEYQPDLQYETVSFIVKLVKEYSTILDR